MNLKKAGEKITSDVYQSVCAFLDCNGGLTYLWGEDYVTITGVKKEFLAQMKKDVVTALNNPQKLNPPLYILSHHKTDTLLRVDNLARYDDRDDIRTNLIEIYDRLMGFTAKHLPDKFHLIGSQRVSLTDRIFREVAANCLIHREYLNPFPVKFIIEKNYVYTENANKTHGYGLINPAGSPPFSKNPVIARGVKEIGRADELGSGGGGIFPFHQSIFWRKSTTDEG